MKSINHKKLVVVSQQTGVSVFLLTRREMKYRKCTEAEKKKLNHCLFCKAHDTPNYDGVQRNQCHIIGIGNNQYADVDQDHICDYFTVSEYKIKESRENERTL